MSESDISEPEQLQDAGSSDEFVPESVYGSTSEDENNGNRCKKRKRKLVLNLRKRLSFETLASKTLVVENTTVNKRSIEQTEEELTPDLSENEQGTSTREEYETIIDDTPKKRARKIMPTPTSWKCNKRKVAHQSGKSYTSRRGKLVPAKEVRIRKDCKTNCKFKCSQKITNDERQEVHKMYYSLTSATEKRFFIINTTERCVTARPKRQISGKDSNISQSSAEEETAETVNYKPRRKYTFHYFFNVNGEKIKVCKDFYLDTLSISQKPVYTAHVTKNTATNTPTSDGRGKSQLSRRVASGDCNSARLHIKSFPVVESHYCRATTERKFLESDLNISKMYDLYQEYCVSLNISPVKKSMYHKIFVTEFNLGFHVPKSDRCDLCEKYKVANKTETLSDDLKENYERHQKVKTAMREARKKDKESGMPMLLFDLQNVILCPHADISSLFYLRKLNVYNLTAYYTITKKVYCAIWPETMAGRAGNDIASALKRILEVVIEENDVNDLITWSDSCVPQNRNSLMSNAVLHFIKENHLISSVTMKYSVPGHSCIQEVDNVHSTIEKAMRQTDFYSPIGLIRILKQVNRKNPYRVIQMRPDDFKDFSGTSKLLNYKTIPFTEVAVLNFTRIFHEVKYKVSHEEQCEKVANLKFPEARKRKMPKPTEELSIFQIKPKIQKVKSEISELKKKDLKAAFPFMPLQDRTYYSGIV